MKLSQRLCSVLLCFALLFPVFSISVSADETKEYTVTISTKYTNSAGTSSKPALTVYPNNGETEQVIHNFPNGIPAGSVSAMVQQGYIIQYTDGSKMFDKGRPSTLSINNVFLGALLTGTGVSTYDRYIDDVRALAYYTDGTYKYYDDVTVENPTTSLTNLILEFTPEHDIYKVEFIVFNNLGLPNSKPISSNVSVDVYCGEFGDPEWALYVKQESEEVGLLQGIIDWLKSIKNGITDLVGSIAELPAKLWKMIEDGLISLFVPDEYFIAEYKENFDVLLSDRLGAVYQVIDVTFDSWDRIQQYDQTDTIDFPEVTIDLPENEQFSFGGYEVKIVPDGFQFLTSILKTIVGIVCTIAFVNGLRKRYDEVMGVEK